MKLFTIGDSISQGFMSGAAARTDQSYSTLIARHLGLPLNKPDGYRFPTWEAGGIPFNLEVIFRRLHRRYGANIRGLEWLTVLQTMNDVVDEVEEYYERGLGGPDRVFGDAPFFHNVAVRGYDVADAWLVTPEVCRTATTRPGAAPTRDGFLSGPDFPFYRTAWKVLNPSNDARYEKYSALSWLEHHARGEGVENLILWLGANNALGTVLELTVRQTPGRADQRPVQLGHLDRADGKWNLWHPDDFAAEYAELLRRTDAIMRTDTAPGWRVFVGTVPLVTIAPLAKGVGPTAEFEVEDETQDGGTHRETYYKYYTYFPFDEATAHSTGVHLTMQQALHIDNCIRAYNRKIKQLVAEYNAAHDVPRYFVVDIARSLREMALKRNAFQPVYQFPPTFEFRYPRVDTKYYHADADGRLKQGGVFSLDGVHPTAVGQGLVAWEFLKVMHAAGAVGTADLMDATWDEIFAGDLLYSTPIPIMQELYQHNDLARHVLRLISRFRD